MNDESPTDSWVITIGGGMSATHERFREHLGVRASSDRTFGLTIGGISLAVGIYICSTAGVGWLAVLLLLVGATLAGLGWFAAHCLTPLNRLWTRLGLLLVRVVSPLIVFVIFALAVVPISVFMRAGGHDPLRLRKNPASGSYWIERRPPGPAPETMTEQF